MTPNETPRLANGAERSVYRALLEQLQPNDRVIPRQRVTDHLKDHEVDFVVAIQGAGIVCLEVKGGEVWHDGDTWWQKRRGHEHRITPVRQAREACYALREYIEKDDRWTQGRLRWDHVIVLPNAEIADDFALPECPRWKVIDRNDLSGLVDKLKYVLIGQELPRDLLTKRGVDQLSVVLSGRGYRNAASSPERWPTRTRPTRSPSIRLSFSMPSACSTVSKFAGEPAAVRRFSPWSRPVDSPRKASACAGLLLPRPGLLPGAHHWQLEAAAPTGVCRRVPRPRQAVGRSRRSG
jgi:hypothetical protein